MTDTTPQHESALNETHATAGSHPEARLHEGLTMALYISLSLLAVLVALPADLSPGEAARPALVVFLTSLGLILAHSVAFRMSTRLLHHGLLSEANRRVAAAQFAGGLAVTAVAVAPVLLLGGSLGVTIAEYLLLAFIAAVGYVTARSAGLSRLRALVYVSGVVVVVVVVIWVKGLVGH